MTERLDLRLNAPCTKSWDDLEGGERSRYCAECDFDVFNLSAVSRAETESYLASRGGRSCLHFVRHPDGRIATTDDPLSCPRPRRRGLRRIAATLAALGTAVLPSCFRADSTEPGGETCPAPMPPESVTEGEHDYKLLAELGGYWGEIGTLEMPDEP